MSATTKDPPAQLDDFQLGALHVAIYDTLMACGHWYAIGVGASLSSHAGRELLRFGLIRSKGTQSVQGARRVWTGEAFEATEEGRRLYPLYVERGPTRDSGGHFKEVVRLLPPAA